VLTIYLAKALSAQAIRQKQFNAVLSRGSKINESTLLLKSDSVSMPRQQKGRKQPANGGAAEKEDGGTVCALCGRTINAGSSASQEPVIYSICPACKRMPYRNPGSTASLC